jgi:hypothetical protein
MIRVTYELLDEFLLDEDGEEIKDKPRWISEDFPLHSLNSDRANSTKRYFALDPTNEFGGDWSQMLGRACVVNIVQNEGKGKNAGRTFNNVGSISTMRDKEAKKAPELVNSPLLFDPSEPDVEVFLSLPQFVQDKIKAAVDFNGGALEQALEAHSPDSKGEGAKKSKKASEEAEVEPETQKSDDEDW